MVEESGVLLGTQAEGVWQVALYRSVSGSAASVEADWAWALDREETCGDVAGFWHTHPAGVGVSPSARDIRTMHAWCSALGKPLLCLIADGETLGGQIFVDDEAEGRRATVIEVLEPGRWSIR